MDRLRGKLSYPKVMATVVAFLVLGGGTAAVATCTVYGPDPPLYGKPPFTIKAPPMKLQGVARFKYEDPIDGIVNVTPDSFSDFELGISPVTFSPSAA